MDLNATAVELAEISLWLDTMVEGIDAPWFGLHLRRGNSLIGARRSFAGSMIGGIPEAQEMLDFCAEHGITADIEMIRADQIEAAYERMLAGDVKYRFVMDIATMKD